jgi:hypothetical protein
MFLAPERGAQNARPCGRLPHPTRFLGADENREIVSG